MIGIGWPRHGSVLRSGNKTAPQSLQMQSLKCSPDLYKLDDQQPAPARAHDQQGEPHKWTRRRTDRAPIPQSPAKALLLRDHAAKLVLLIGLIAGVTLVSYVVRVARNSYPPVPPAWNGKRRPPART